MLIYCPMTTKKLKKAKEQHKTVGFVALGCPKNSVDAEVMLAKIGLAGFVLTDDPDCADVVVINTCGFIEPAKQEALTAIRRAIKMKRNGKIGKIVVAGCLAQRLGGELAELAGHVDAVVGLGQRDSMDAIIRDLLSQPEQKTTQIHLPGLPDIAFDDRNRLRITPPHWAYLRISEGCNRRCSFCTIPEIRGKFRSKPMDWLVDEARQLVQSGSKEISLIAQDSNFYGRDMKIEDGLIKLIGELEKVDGLEWIRLMYLYPAAVEDSLIEAIAQSPKVVHYVDIPIQHINNQILHSMRRSDTKEHTIGLIERLRKRLPDAVLRTTVIAGYPGETEAQFDELLDFIRWAKFDALGCFPFFPEPGTRAAQLPDRLPDDVRNQRADIVMETQQPIAFANVEKRIGSILKVLIDETGKSRQAVGRFFGQAPQIDSVCLVENTTAQAGTWIQAKAVKRSDYDLVVRPV